jgi:hypothetical protein
MFRSSGCQILAVGLLGITFDLVYSFLFQGKQPRAFRKALIAPLTIWIGFTVFAFIAVYLIQSPWWVTGGLAKIGHYVLVEGSIAAVVGFLLMQLGSMVGGLVLPSLRRLQYEKVGMYYAGTCVIVVCASVLAVVYR